MCEGLCNVEVCSPQRHSLNFCWVATNEKMTLLCQYVLWCGLWWCSKLWSFLVTGTAGRHELKIWSTQTWSCLQMVTLLIPPTGVSSPGSAVTTHDSYLQLAVDLSATYLVLCDISRKVTFCCFVCISQVHCSCCNSAVNSWVVKAPSVQTVTHWSLRVRK